MQWYYHHMPNDVYDTARDCHSCAQNCTHRRRQLQIKLFFLKGLLEYIYMDIRRPLLKSRQGNQFVVMTTDGYTKLTNVIRTTKTRINNVSRSVLGHLVANYDILSKLLTENSPQFVSEIFVAVCSTLEVNNIPTTEYRP